MCRGVTRHPGHSGVASKARSIAREEEGENPNPKMFGCEALPFTTACKRGKNLKMEEAQCAEAYSQVRWLRRLP
jgi:hypothetical protein